MPTRPPYHHKLKCWPEPFNATKNRRKRHEYRKDDREPRFEVGDVLVLHEFHNQMPPTYSGKKIKRTVTYITRGPDFGVPVGYVVMSIA